MSMLETVLSQFEDDIKNNSDPNLQAIADFLLEKAEESGSGLVERLLEKGKSLSSCLNYIMKKAFLQITKGGTERPKGNHAVSAVRSEIVYEWALEYYRSEETEVEFDPMAMMPKPPATKINTGVVAKKNPPPKKLQNLVSFPSLFDLAENPAGQEASSVEPDKKETDECDEADEDPLDEADDKTNCEDETENDSEDVTVCADDCIQPTELPVSDASTDQTFVLNPPKSGVIPIVAPVVSKTPELEVVKTPDSIEPVSELFTDIPASAAEKKKRSRYASAVDNGQLSLFAM